MQLQVEIPAIAQSYVHYLEGTYDFSINTFCDRWFTQKVCTRACNKHFLPRMYKSIQLRSIHLSYTCMSIILPASTHRGARLMHNMPGAHQIEFSQLHAYECTCTLQTLIFIIDLPAQTLYCTNAQVYHLPKPSKRWFYIEYLSLV